MELFIVALILLALGLLMSIVMNRATLAELKTLENKVVDINSRLTTLEDKK